MSTPTDAELAQAVEVLMERIGNESGAAYELLELLASDELMWECPSPCGNFNHLTAATCRTCNAPR